LLRWADTFFLPATFHGKSPLDHPTMRKSILTLAALLFIGGSAFAGSFRLHYSIRGAVET
jgi:hypothetical protein